jgi:hypothetical protein
MADVMDVEIQAQTVAGTLYRQIYLYPDGSTQRAQIMVRNDHEPGAPVYLLMFFHGKGGDESNFNVARSKTTRNALMDDGNWIVTQSNAGGVSWGNNLSLQSYQAIYEYAARTYNVAGVATYGQSMGGIPSLLTIQAGTVPGIFAHVGVAQWTDLRSAWDHPQDYKGGIRDAYFPGLSKTLENYLQYSAGHDPMLYPPDDFPVPVRLYASPDDLATPIGNSEAWVGRLSGLVAEAELVACSGAHLSTSHYQPGDLMAFLGRHAPAL